VIARVSDDDGDAIRDLEAAGLLPGVAVEVVSAGARQIEVLIEGRSRRIAAGLAAAIYIVPDTPLGTV
jgi:hypothetical protein